MDCHLRTQASGHLIVSKSLKLTCKSGHPSGNIAVKHLFGNQKSDPTQKLMHLNLYQWIEMGMKTFVQTAFYEILRWLCRPVFVDQEKEQT